MENRVQFTTFWVDGVYFGLEVDKVQEVLRYQQMTRVPLAPTVVKGLINLRGQIVTAIDLRSRLGLRPRGDGALPMNVVIRSNDGAVSLLVDEIGDVLTMDSDFAEPLPDTVRGIGREFICCVYKLNDCILLVLDSDKAIALGSTYRLQGEDDPTSPPKVAASTDTIS